MTHRLVTRRRAICIIVGMGAALMPSTPRAGSVEWTGHALGAQARMLFPATDRTIAEDAIRDCLQEIERLERIFSLYRPDSELVRLNTQGVLVRPSLDLLSLLRQCKALNEATNGLFDPTVQSVWEHLSTWYAGQPDRAPSPPDLLTRALDTVGMDRVEITTARVGLARGTRLTLNGIAQGYITDRVAELLRRRGWTHVLVDLGEVSAIGGRPTGQPFDVAIRDSGIRLPLENAALATSSVNGFVFSPHSRHSHLINPHSPAAPVHWQSVTVRNSRATIADGLSTALALASPAEVMGVARRFRDTQVWAVDADGRLHAFS